MSGWYQSEGEIKRGGERSLTNMLHRAMAAIYIEDCLYQLAGPVLGTSHGTHHRSAVYL